MGVFIIAEIGVNHNGSVTIAKKMIDVAVEAGVDCVKFQAYKTENLVTLSAKKAEYQEENMKNSGSQYEMLKSLELTKEDFIVLKEYCNQKGVEFLATPFDFDSIDFLYQMGMKVFKIPSGEVTNLPFLRKIAKTKKKVIMSTGMCDLNEIEAAVEVLRDSGCPKVSLLQCTTEYPTKYSDVNLKVIENLRNHFHSSVGLSDHTNGIEISIAAVALGAEIIEKHFTLDKTMEGPDHKASIEPHELKALVQSIRHVEEAFGSSTKTPTSKELVNRNAARKSIVANCDIKKGTILTDENITVKRPGGGISPMQWDDVVGTIAMKDFSKDELIEVR